MEYFCTHADSVADVLGAFRDNHILLKISAPVGVSATIDDIHHGHGEGHFAPSAGEFGDVFVEMEAELLSLGFGGSHRDGQNGIGAEFFLIRGAV